MWTKHFWPLWIAMEINSLQMPPLNKKMCYSMRTYWRKSAIPSRYVFRFLWIIGSTRPQSILYLQAIREETKADIEKRLYVMTDQLIEDFKRISGANKEFATIFQNGNEPKVKRQDHIQCYLLISDSSDQWLTTIRFVHFRTPGQLSEKKFQARNSLLTDLFGVKHIRTIYHIFVVCMFLTFLNTIVHDLVVDGR